MEDKLIFRSAERKDTPLILQFIKKLAKYEKMENEVVADEVKADNPDEQLGITIFANALKAPFKTILENAGVDYTAISKEIIAKGDLTYGYNARTLQLVDLLEEGIIDPVKVLIGTVYAASSIASVVLTSSVIITEDPKSDNNLVLNTVGMPMV